MRQFEKKEIKKRSANLSDWYNDIVQKAELADYGPVRGTMVIRPYGYAIWERVQEVFNGMIKRTGVQNAYFPLFIPYKFLQREKEHVKGFSPELALVTIGGGQELDEPLVVRPTSETIMYEMYSKWIHSWRDLPMKINQWNNVVRWEKRTYLFLRTMEFLWQEGHTAHSTTVEADEMALQALEWYRQIYEDYFAIPVIRGIKSETEKFAGAVRTYAVEPLMPDGKALQAATSHHLGQNFARAFNIQFQDEKGENQFVWQTSWGLSTRSLGGIFLTHGDDNGLIMPPKIAPYQVIIIPVFKADNSNNKLIEYVMKIESLLVDFGFRVYADMRTTQSVGRKFNEWELKGVPLRFEIGEKEMQAGVVTAVQRDNGEKHRINNDELEKKVNKILDGIQRNLFARANQFLNTNIREVKDLHQFKAVMLKTKGYVKAYWCEDPVCELKIKEETKASTRVKPLEPNAESGKCVYCGKAAKSWWYFAQAY